MWLIDDCQPLYSLHLTLAFMVVFFARSVWLIAVRRPYDLGGESKVEGPVRIGC